MKNPIYKELKDLKLISDKNLYFINNKTRDKKIRVIKDKKSEIIFLEKFVTNSNFYKSTKYKNDDREFTNIKIKNRKHNLPTNVKDDLRRANQFNKMFKNKDVLDFGCSWGSLLKSLKNSKSINGVEIRKECTEYIKKNIKKINLSDNINSFSKKFDIISIFHVLEHMPQQIKTLKLLRSKLKNKGKVIIEVPHAKDFLILQNELKEFKDFTFWSEHLILHTYKSLKTILSKSGFKKIKIQFYQRYNFSNHLGWFLKKKPGGHLFYKNFSNKKLDKIYKENLIRLGQTDTLIAIAQKN
jgi:2-polyprenyl-3-methyl-5-hydroxy-6-metoxy-1,4-benzoquinol methylase